MVLSEHFERLYESMYGEQSYDKVSVSVPIELCDTVDKIYVINTEQKICLMIYCNLVISDVKEILKPIVWYIESWFNTSVKNPTFFIRNSVPIDVIIFTVEGHIGTYQKYINMFQFSHEDYTYWNVKGVENVSEIPQVLHGMQQSN